MAMFSPAIAGTPDAATAQRCTEILQEVRTHTLGYSAPAPFAELANIQRELATCSPELCAYVAGLRNNCRGLLMEKGAFAQQLATEQVAHQNTKISDAQAKDQLHLLMKNYEEAKALGVIQMGIDLDRKLMALNREVNEKMRLLHEQQRKEQK